MIATVNNMEWVNFLECFAREHKYPIYRTVGAILISDPADTAINDIYEIIRKYKER